MAKKFSETQRETLNHYDRMIRWAKKQMPKKRTFEIKMALSIGESWHGEYCPYCQKYLFGTGDCKECPLKDKDKKEKSWSGRCCSGLWHEMNRSKTWGKWVEAAQKVRQYIKANGYD